MRHCTRWLLGITLLVACGDDVGKDGTGTSDPDASGTGCATCGTYGKVVGALCDLHARCPAEAYPVAYRGRAECMDVFAFLLTCRLEDDEVDDVHHYRLVQSIPKLDDAQADACVAWLQTADCRLLDGALDDDDDDEGQAPTNPCAGLLTQPDEDDDYYRAAGEPCDDRSCQPGLYCTAATLAGDGVPVCEVCKALPALGEPCAQYRCDDALFCDGLAAPPTCSARFADGVACLGNETCVSGFCHSATQLCVSGGFIGDPCAGQVDCRDNNLCDGGVCALRRLQGAACERPEQCNSGVCEAGHCGLADGATCTNDYDCAGRCDEALGVCAPGIADGQVCQVDEDCASHRCDPFQRVCKRECFDNDECGAGEYCNWQYSACQPKSPDGSGCEDDEACLSGSCRVDEVCGAPPEIGDACQQSYECYPLGTCSGGQCIARKSAGQACEALDGCLEPLLCQNGRCQMMNLECKPAAPGKLCAWLRVCQDNAYCDVFAGFVCKAKKQSGAECLRADECADGLRCALSVEQATQTCQPRAQVGATCNSGADCVEGSFCLQNGSESTCQAGPIGQPCDRYDDAFPCPAGLFCSDDNQCRAPGALGEECSYDEPCAAGLYCPSFTCRPLEVEGAPCSPNPPACAPTLHCGPGYLCAKDKLLDQECDTSPEDSCAAGLSCTYVDGELLNRCRPGLAVGVDCYDDEQCASGVCHDDLGCVATAQCVMP